MGSVGSAADRRTAWKLRGAIYGSLAVVGGVAFLLRASAREAADELPALSGTTDQGASVMLHIDGSRIASLDVASIGGRCRTGSPYAIS
jgi:hypothetical protein